MGKAFSDTTAGVFRKLAAVCRLILLWGCGAALLLMVVAILVDVILWTGFRKPSAALSELQWHLYGFVGMAGMSYTMLKGKHIRVDILFDRYPGLVKRIVESVGIIVFMMPLAVFLAVNGYELVESAWRVAERSAVEGGLASRWIPKAFIPSGSVLLLISGMIRLYDVWGKKTREVEENA